MDVMSEDSSDSEQEEAPPRLKFTYSRHLRDKIMDINPHRIPCMYMEVLEENAVQTLLGVSELSNVWDPNCETDNANYLADKESWQLWLPPRACNQTWRETEQTTFNSTEMTGAELKQSASLSDLVTCQDKVQQTDAFSARSSSRPPRQVAPGMRKVQQAWPDLTEKKVKESTTSEDNSCEHVLHGMQVLKQYEVGGSTSSSFFQSHF